MSAQPTSSDVTLEERIAASVAAAPRFTDEQAHLIRTLLAPRLVYTTAKARSPRRPPLPAIDAAATQVEGRRGSA